MFGRWLVIFGTVVILLLILTAALAPWIAPYDPLETDMTKSLQQPSSEHLLGTDRLGRDVLSRVIYGSRVSLWVGVIAISLASIIGISMGMAAGFFGRFTNAYNHEDYGRYDGYTADCTGLSHRGFARRRVKERFDINRTYLWCQLTAV